MSTICVPTNTPEFIALQKETQLTPAILQAKVSLWMEKNVTDRFPTARDIYRSSMDRLYSLNQEDSPLEFNTVTLNAINQFLEKVGVEQRLVDSFNDANGNPIENALAAANFIKGTIDIIDDVNKRPEAWNKLPEEAAHWWYRLLIDSSSLKTILAEDKATQAKVEQLMQSEYADLIDNPSVFTEEAVGQLIADAIKKVQDKNSDEADYSFLKRFIAWINKILSMFSSIEQDPFEVAAMKILASDVSDLMTIEDYNELNNAIYIDTQLTQDSATGDNNQVIQIEDNQIFFDRLLNKTYRKRTKFLPKTLEKYYTITDANNLASIYAWNKQASDIAITKKLNPFEKEGLENAIGYENVTPTLKILPNLLQKYNKRPISLNEQIKIDGAKKQELQIIQKVIDLIKEENPGMSTISSSDLANEVTNFLHANYLLGFANENNYITYRIDQTFSAVKDRITDEDVDMTTLTDEQVTNMSMEERRRLATILGLTKQNPGVYHNKISLRFNDEYFPGGRHFNYGPSAWGNLTYFYTGDKEYKDAVLLHEIQNDNIEFLREFKLSDIDLDSQLALYINQITQTVKDNIELIKSGGKKVVTDSMSIANPDKVLFGTPTLTYFLSNHHMMHLEQGFNALKQLADEIANLSILRDYETPDAINRYLNTKFSHKRQWEDFIKRGGLKSVLTKQEIDELASYLKEANKPVPASARWLADENQYEPVEPGAMEEMTIDKKKAFFADRSKNILDRVNNYLKETYGKNAVQLEQFKASAVPLPKSQRANLTTRRGRQVVTYGNSTNTINESVNYLLYNTERSTLQDQKKSIVDLKQQKLTAYKKQQTNRFFSNLRNITLEQYSTLIDNYKANIELFEKSLKAQTDKELKSAYNTSSDDTSDKVQAQMALLEEFKNKAIQKRNELQQAYTQVEAKMKSTLELEMNYFTPLVHHILQKYIKQTGKNIPLYFSGFEITKLTQGNDRTALIYAGPDEVRFTKEEADLIKYKAAYRLGLLSYNAEDGSLLTVPELKEGETPSKPQIADVLKKLSEFKRQSKQNLDRVVYEIMNLSGNRPIETGAIYNALSQIPGVKLIWQPAIKGIKDTYDSSLAEVEYSKMMRPTGGYLVDLTNYNYTAPVLYGLSNKSVPLFNKIQSPATFEERVVKYLQDNKLVNYKKETHNKESYFIVRRYQEGTYNPYSGKGEYVMYDNIHKLNSIRESYKNKNGWYPFELKELANNKVAVIVNSQAALFNKEDNQDYLTESTFRDIAEKLSSKTGIEYEIISSEDVESILQEADYNSEPAFFHNGKVYFVRDRLTKENALHEFAHPFILSLKKDNPSLYASIVANLKTSDDQMLKRIHEFVKANYPEELQSDELFVRALTEIGKNQVVQSGVLKSLIDRFLFYIKQLLRQLFGRTVKLEDLSLNTSIEELANILYDDNIKFETSVQQSDYVLFNKPMAEEFAKMENDTIVKNIQNFHDTLLTTLHRLKRSDYRALAEAVAKEGDSNYFKSAQQLTDSAKQLEDDIEKQSIRLQNFAQAVLNIRLASEKMRDHVVQLSKHSDVTEQDKLSALVNYMYIVSDWEQVFDILRQDNTKDLPLIGDEINRTLNNFKKIHDFRDSIFKSGLVSVLREHIAPVKAAAEAYFPPQIKFFKEAIAKGEKGLQKKLDDYERMYKRFSYSDEAILDYLSGKMGDTNMFSAMLESYSSSPDPIIGGFATFLNKNLYEVESYIFRYKTDLTAELDPYYKKLGIDRSNPEALGRLITYEDVIPTNATGTLEGFKTKWLLNPYSNGWLFDYMSKEQAIKKAVEDKDYEKAGQLKKEFEEFKAQYFNREYKDEVYNAKNFWHESPVNQAAYQKRKAIIDQLRAFDDWAELNEEDLEMKDQLEKELRTLGSTRNLDGTEKTGDDLDIAKAIQEYYQRNKGIYEEIEIKGAFNRAMEQYQLELEEQGLQKDTPEYNKKLNSWIKSNIRIQNSELFYNTRQALINEVDSIIQKLPSDEAAKLQISELWKRIIEQVKGFRDQNGQPMGGEISDEKLKYIKDDQEEIERIRQTLRKLSGLTIEEQDRLSDLFSMMRGGLVLSASEQEDFEDLMARKNKFGLSDADKARLMSLFEELQDLSGRIPTEYYLEAINEKLIQSGIKLNITLDNIDSVLYGDYIDPILEDHPEFKKWFLANHIKKTKWDKESKINRDVYERLYTWSRIIPNEPELRKLLNTNDYQSLLSYSSPNVTIKKARRYHFYRIRNDLRTERIVGVNVDNRGHWLPKSKEQGGPEKYLNKEYYRLKESGAQRDKDILKIAEIYAKYHLKAQEGTPVKNRLYLEVPRMRKERLEVVNSALSKPGESISTAIEWAKAKINPNREADDFDTGQTNTKDDSKIYVMTDLFGNETTSIPVRYMSKLDIDMTTYDIGKAIVSYAASVRTSKQLHDINPIAKALVSVVESNGIQDVDKISKRSFYNTMMNIVPKSKDNVRLKAIKNLIEREFEGIESKMELGVFANRVAQHLSGLAAFGTMAVNVPGHLKNMFSARIQSIMEASIGQNFDGKAWLQASSEFAFKWIPQMVSDYNKLANKTLASQIVEAFDPVQGKFMERLGHEFAGSVKKDLIDFKYPTAGQAFGEMEAQGSALLAMMKFTRVPVNKFDGTTQMMSYDKVWTLRDGKLSLIDGADKEWDLGGKKFIEFKAKMHKVNELLQGAYAKMNQAEASRYTSGRLALFMRRYFVPGFVNRFAFMRPNFALGTFREGNYVTFVKTARDFARTGTRTWQYMTPVEKRMFMRTLIEMGYSMAFLALLSLMGYNDNDKKRFKKLKSNSWVENMLIYEILLTKGEAETFIPVPGMGVNELLRIKDSPSIAFPLINKYYKLFSHFYDTVTDPFSSGDQSHFSRKTGIYEKGELKLKADLFKILGYSGYTEHPEEGIKAYSQTMNRYK